MHQIDASYTVGPAPRATRREWIRLGVIALPCLLYSMDLTVLNLAVPHLSADLQPSSAQLLWIIDIYGFLVAGSLITMGTLGCGTPEQGPRSWGQSGGSSRDPTCRSPSEPTRRSQFKRGLCPHREACEDRAWNADQQPMHRDAEPDPQRIF